MNAPQPEPVTVPPDAEVIAFKATWPRGHLSREMCEKILADIKAAFAGTKYEGVPVLVLPEGAGFEPVLKVRPRKFTPEEAAGLRKAWDEIVQPLHRPSHGETFTVPTEAKVEPLDEIPVEFTDGRAVFQNRPLSPTPGESPFVVLEPRELPDAPDEPAVVEGRPDA